MNDNYRRLQNYLHTRQEDVIDFKVSEVGDSVEVILKPTTEPSTLDKDGFVKYKEHYNN